MAFVEFVFVRILHVVLDDRMFGYNGPSDFLGMILVSFFIGALVLIILALIKKGAKMMINKVRMMSIRGQKPKQNNEHATKRKLSLAWV